MAAGILCLPWSSPWSSNRPSDSNCSSDSNLPSDSNPERDICREADRSVNHSPRREVQRYSGNCDVPRYAENLDVRSQNWDGNTRQLKFNYRQGEPCPNCGETKAKQVLSNRVTW